jgi:hypothetical protein
MSDGTEVHLLPPDGSPSQVAAEQRIAELEAELAQAREAMCARQRLGIVTGLVAQRYGVHPEEAWALLVRLSQHTNVKVREVARVISEGFAGRVAEEDRALAARLNRLRPAGTRPLVDLDRAGVRPGRRR